jgi:stress response protein SCP2
MVEQDITLKKGQKIILSKPAETIDRLLKGGIIDEATAEKRKGSIPEWKTHEADVLPDRD